MKLLGGNLSQRDGASRDEFRSDKTVSASLRLSAAKFCLSNDLEISLIQTHGKVKDSPTWAILEIGHLF